MKWHLEQDLDLRSSYPKETVPLPCNQNNIHLIAQQMTQNYKNKDCLIGVDIIASQELVELKKIKEDLYSKINSDLKVSVTPLLYATMKGSKEVVEAILKKEHTFREETSSLVSSAIYHGHPEVAEVFIKEGIDLENRVSNNNVGFPLMFAISHHQFALARKLVEKGVDINKLNKCKNALFLALQIARPCGWVSKQAITPEIKEESLEMAKFLLYAARSS